MQLSEYRTARLCFAFLLAFQTAFSENTICVGLSRVGGDNQRIASGCLKELCDVDLGEPLHSLIIAGRMHPLEIGMLREFAINSKTFDKFAEAQCIG